MKQVKKKQVVELANGDIETTYFYDLGDIIEVTSGFNEKGQYDVYPHSDSDEWLEAETLNEAKKLLEGC